MKWFRFYSEVVHDPKVQRLPPDLFKLWINLLCLANDNPERGKLPADVNDLAWTLRLDVEDLRAELRTLQGMGLLDWSEDDKRYSPHNWNERQKPSDDVTARVNKHRGKETLQVSDSETLQKRYSNALDKNRLREEKKENRTDKREKVTAQAPTPIPTDFELTDDLYNSVRNKYPDLDIEAATEEWVNSMQANQSKYKYTDWNAAWRNAMKRADTWQKERGTKGGYTDDNGRPLNKRSQDLLRTLEGLRGPARPPEPPRNSLRLVTGEDSF